MPRIRKLSAEEVWHIEAEQRATARAEDAATQLATPPRSSEPRQGRSIRTNPPSIGDIVDMPGRERGIVVQVRRALDGSWDYAEVLVSGQRRWIRADLIGTIVGRPVGISRIDHPRKRTYGWYVRAYTGRTTRVARFFSDLKYGGRAAALGAAITYREAAQADAFTTQPIAIQPAP